MADVTVQQETTQPIAGRAPWKELFKVQKEQVQAMALLGSSYYEQGQNRNAEAIFQGLIALDDTSYYGYAGMGALTLSEGRLDEALNYLRRAAELEPKDPTVRANLGETLLRQAKFQDAAAEFENALRIDAREQDLGANRARAILQGMEVVLQEFRRKQAPVN